MTDASLPRGSTWKGLALAGICITVLAFASSVYDVYTDWHGDHFERVAGTILVLLVAVIVSFVLSVAALIGGWRSRARSWGLIALATAVVAPFVFVIVVFAWAGTG